MSEIEVVLHARLDEEKLDAFVRSLYDGVEHDDPAPGEPQPGRQYVDDVVEEGRAGIAKGQAPDLSWLDGYGTDGKRGFIASLTIQRGTPVVICSEQEAALVRSLLKRHIRLSEKAHVGAQNPEQVWGSLGAARALLERMGDACKDLVR